MGACFLCQEDSAKTFRHGTSGTFVECQTCGTFTIGDRALAMITGNADETVAHDLASWVYYQNRESIQPKISDETITWFATYPRPNAKKRAELYLGAVIRILNGQLMGRFEPATPVLRVASWSSTQSDCIALADYLVSVGALSQWRAESHRLLTVQGHMLHEEMVANRASSSQGFVAMWFAPSHREAYDEGLAIGISEAGYSPFRIDRSEHVNKIDDQIIAEIRRSAFVVADFTEHRGGVYYEAGFAHGLEKRVIFTCRKDHMKELHFDIRQYNTIEWERPGDIVKPLQNRILALFGAGPIRPDAKPL